MSRFISTLLEKEKNILESTIERLEEASGHTNIDVRLTSELVVKAKSKIKELGLDPDDTIARELYHALQGMVGLHDQFLAKKMEINDDTSPAQAMLKIAKLANSIALKKSSWSLKHSVAKRMLKALPPKQLMRQLGYRSLDSMLKRESIDKLFAGACIAESKDWLENFYSSFAKLHPSDFESKKMHIELTEGDKWAKLSSSYIQSSRSNVVDVKILGSVVLLPINVDNLDGISITVLSLILQRLNELKLYSSYLKFVQVENDFGKLLSSSASDEPVSYANMAGQDLHWQVILKHLNQISEENSEEVYEPHLQTEDLSFEPIEESLYKIEPALHFWYGTDGLGLPYDGYSVSFNLIDVATNYLNKLPVESGSTFYLQQALWDELMERYLSEQPLHEQVIQQIDNELTAGEYEDDKLGGVAIA